MSDSNLRHLPSRPRPVQPSGPSLDFALMAATKHAENGDHNAAWTAVLDALAIMYRADHEGISPDRFAAHLRALGGVEYQPPSAA